MPHSIPLQTIFPDGISLDSSAIANSSSKQNSPETTRRRWEEKVREWLSSFQDHRSPSISEIDVWIDSNWSSIPEELTTLPRSNLHQRILSFQFIVPDHSQAGGASQGEFHYRFQRTDQWRPVYSWLESMDIDTIVSSKEITEWLSLNTGFRDRLLARHSRYHLMHYIQKLHLKLLKKKGKLPKGMMLSAARASVKKIGGPTPRDKKRKASSDPMNDDGVFKSKRNDAFLRYELLTELQKQLISILPKHRETNSPIKDFKLSFHCQKKNHSSDLSSDLKMRNVEEIVVSKPASSSPARNTIPLTTLDGHVGLPRNPIPQMTEVANIDLTRNYNSKSLADAIGQKMRRDPIIATPAWSYSEALPDRFLYSHSREDRKDSSSFRKTSCTKNIAMCLLERELGSSWPLLCSSGVYSERNQKRWIPLLQGWRSLECQFEGPAGLLKRRNYSSWMPAWCAYTSSATIAQPHGRQGTQKVLSVKFHPEGLPQLVCSYSEAPNELLLYNLHTGKANQLTGHGCQIQAVEFAVRGASIVSCGSNLLKVWDCTTGSCLFTMGPSSNDQSAVGHSQKINAMTVNYWQSCLVVTGGRMGDGKLLLWNALRGELAADLNSHFRAKTNDLPSIDAMEFCNESLLACSSVFDGGGSSVVQLWDIDSLLSLQCFPANNSLITSLKVNPQSSTLITGAADGTIGLFDIRTSKTIDYLSVGLNNEITSVSFSSCGTYFSASSTLNSTLVWDIRLMPTNARYMPMGKCFSDRDVRLIRPLHCLSHGKQMPTADYTGQLPGHVDEGNQGVNDARWLQNESVLITASGDGSIAMWDVNLGKPCIRHLISHSRCVNSISVAPNGDYFCSGGDDQKVVLYHNMRGRTRLKWRLSHPLARKAHQ